MQPLLELVEHDQHLLANRDALPSPERRQRLLQAQVVFQGRTRSCRPGVRQNRRTFFGKQFRLNDRKGATKSPFVILGRHSFPMLVPVIHVQVDQRFEQFVAVVAREGLHKVFNLWVAVGVQCVFKPIANPVNHCGEGSWKNVVIRGRMISAVHDNSLRAAFSQAMQKTGFSFFRRGLDVDGNHILGQSRQQARLDQRRLTATGRTINQPHRKRIIGIGFFNARFPEADAVRQAVSVPRPRQQFQEEVSVMGVERPQAFRDDLDLDRLTVRAFLR